MSRGFYRKMALTNIRNNRQFYLPYMLTILLTVSMFYNMFSIGRNPVYQEKVNTSAILDFGLVLMGVFSVIFLFYTNSFLMKRRKKELGLYHILGMEKKHISRVLLWETAEMAFFGIGLGLLFGILLDRLLMLIILKIFHIQAQLTWEIRPEVLKITALFFGLIFLLIFFYGVFQVCRTSAVELLKSEQAGEREPKGRWLVAILGAILVGKGYYMALTIHNIMEALTGLFTAVALVAAGTYLLFFAGSIAVLKLLRKRRSFYYKTNHFVAVSGMIYRMKQNAIGLANICILSTGVLLVLSTTVCLYGGIEDILKIRYPYEISAFTSNGQEYHDMDEENEKIRQTILDTAKEEGAVLENFRAYTSLELTLLWTEEGLSWENNDRYEISDLAVFTIVDLEDYRALTGENLELEDNQAAVQVRGGRELGELELFGKQYEIVDRDIEVPLESQMSQMTENQYYLAVTDETLEQIYEDQKKAYQDYYSVLQYQVEFDVAGGEENAVAFYEAVSPKVETIVSCRYVDRQQAYSLYGSFLFLGIFLGSLFLMATVLIIYYKQIVEGYEDRGRYRIMKKVGMDRREIKRSIKSQILMLFFLPLVTALIHCCVAFPLMRQIMGAFYMNNVRMFLICTAVTAGIFTLVYILVYAATARSYYKIVNE